MKKALNNPFLWRALALFLTTLIAAGQSTPPRAAIDLNQLQGHWEGEGAGGKCTITITGNSLHYRAGTNWWKTTFTLPAGTAPQQLHATITESWPPSKDAIGQVVPAIIKIEDGTLTLAAFDKSQDPPKTFDDTTSTSTYIVKQVQPKKENAERPKTN